MPEPAENDPTNIDGNFSMYPHIVTSPKADPHPAMSTPITTKVKSYKHPTATIRYPKP